MYSDYESLGDSYRFHRIALLESRRREHESHEKEANQLFQKSLSSLAVNSNGGQKIAATLKKVVDSDSLEERTKSATQLAREILDLLNSSVDEKDPPPPYSLDEKKV